MEAAIGEAEEAYERREGRRQECERCKRPQRVCVCQALPAHLIRLTGHVLVLQHPHELKKRLATVPLLKCCLDRESLSVVTGRKLQQPGSNPGTDALLAGAQRGEYPLYILFPGPDAQDLSGVAQSEEHIAALKRAASRRAPNAAGNVEDVGSQKTNEAASASVAAASDAGAGVDGARGGLVGMCCLSGAGGACGDERYGDAGHAASLSPGASPAQTAPKAAAAAGGRTAAGQGTLPLAPPRQPGSSCGGGPGVTLSPSSNAASSAADGSAGYAAAATAPPGAPSSPMQCLPPPAYLLMVIDGTWRQAREMYRAVASRCMPPEVPGIQVALRAEEVLPAFPPSAPQHPAATGPPANGAQQAVEAAVPVPGPTQVMSSQAAIPLPGDGTLEPLYGAKHGLPSLTLGVEPAQVQAMPPGPEATARALQQAGSVCAEVVNPRHDGDSGLAGPVVYNPEMPCLIRKEPAVGFVTTYEATARALGLLERDVQLATVLLGPLRLMTRLQASFSPAVLSRMRAEPEHAPRLAKTAEQEFLQLAQKPILRD